MFEGIPTPRGRTPKLVNYPCTGKRCLRAIAILQIAGFCAALVMEVVGFAMLMHSEWEQCSMGAISINGILVCHPCLHLLAGVCAIYADRSTTSARVRQHLYASIFAIVVSVVALLIRVFPSVTSTRECSVLTFGMWMYLGTALVCLGSVLGAVLSCAGVMRSSRRGRAGTPGYQGHVDSGECHFGMTRQDPNTGYPYVTVEQAEPSAQHPARCETEQL